MPQVQDRQRQPDIADGAARASAAALAPSVPMGRGHRRREAQPTRWQNTLAWRNLLFAFAAGVVAAHWLPAPHALAAPLLWLGVGLLPIRGLRLGGMALVGLGWAGGQAASIAAAQLAAPCGAADLAGRIVGLPTAQHFAGVGSAQRFLLQLETPQCGLKAGQRVRLAWLRGPALGGGERWRLQARLRPPRAAVNRHGFDLERWFLRHEIAATGYVVAGARWQPRSDRSAPPRPAFLAGMAAAIDAGRDRIRQALRRLPLVNPGVLAALTVGDGGAVPPEEVARYRRTGTLHLLVISGLHVGIATALGFLLGRGIGRLTGAPATPCGIATALLLAAAYVLVAGAGLSVIRAYVMSAAALLALAGGRGCPPAVLFAHALAVVLLLDPLAPLAAGFWLSFGAVAALLGYFACRWPRASPVRGALAAQLVMAAAFGPAAAALTGLLHPLSLIINLVAVPAISLVVLPLALAGVALLATPAGPWLVVGADFALAVVDVALTVSDRVAPLHVADLGGWWAWLVAVGVACLLPVGRLAKLALGACVAAALSPGLLPRPEVPYGEVRVNVLDVGQGTAALVETANRRLLYDTGAAFPTGGDMGARVVLPALRGAGVGRLDMLVLSHADVDHAGGAASVLGGVSVGRILVGEGVPGLPPSLVAPCAVGTSWRWDGVRFSVLAPPADHGRRGNDASCVLLVDTGKARALLPGDIERGVEARLDLPPVDLLLVPHHGSATSSSAAFVAAARPRLAVATTGHANRFRHPHPAVVARYRAVGAHVVATANAGALRWRSDRPAEVAAARCRQAAYWHRGASVDQARLLPCGWPQRVPLGTAETIEKSPAGRK